MIHQHWHPPEERCGDCAEWSPQWLDLALRIGELANQMKEGFAMTESNQEHLERDVAALRDSVSTAVQELKDQIAAGAAPEALDFTSLDALAADEAAEAAADAPPPPPA